MISNLKKAILPGLSGTAIMTLVMMVAPLMGMPKMSPPNMLAMMMGVPVFVGWVMHFMIGVIFAFAFFLFQGLFGKISNLALRGAVFGFSAFVFAQIVMPIMAAMLGGAPAPQGSMVLMMMGSILGHVIFGIAVSLTGLRFEPNPSLAA